MRSIDSSLILHDVPARMSYLQSFINFDPATDGDLLVSCKPYFTSDVLNSMNDQAFNKLLEYDVTRLPLARMRRTDDDEGPKVEDLHRQHPNIKHSQFVPRLIRGVLNNKDWSPTGQFWTYFDLVGRAHLGLDDAGLPSRKNKPLLEVHIRDMSLLTGLLEDAVIDLLMDAKDLTIKQKCDKIKAWNKFWWLQNDLFARWQTTGPGEAAKASEPIMIEA